MQSTKRPLRPLARRFRPTLETLEGRLVPAITTPLVATPGGTIGMFTDSDGDDVTVIVRGTTGTASFVDSNSMTGVADGTNISSITVANASADFSLTFLDTNTTGGGSVILGDILIQNNRFIRGIYTVDPSSGDTDFQLTSFRGKGLSANGTIGVDTIVGDNQGVGVDVASLGAGRSIDVHDSVTGDINIHGNFGGSIKVGGNTFSGALNIDGDWLKGGLVINSGALPDWSGLVKVGGTLGGEAIANGEVSGNWQITGNVTASAHLLAGGSWANLDFNGNFNGQLSASVAITDLDIQKGIGATGRLAATATSHIFVQKTIAAGSIINILGPASTLDLDMMNGNLGGTVTSEDDLTLDMVTGSVLKSAVIGAGGEALVNLASGNFGGSVTAFSLDFRTSNASVTKTAVIQAAFVQDSMSDVDSSGFFVGGSFAGILEVIGTFGTGAGASTTVIAGKITSTAHLTIANPLASTSGEYVFGNRLEGQLTFLGDLMVNIAVNGSVAGPSSGIKVFGQVAANSVIHIVGNLSFLSSFSGFDVVDAHNGNFVTADNMTTGTLVVDGTRGTVMPLV